ncbi:Glutathione-regulated potassium-efflux system protein KefB [uncultured archaeon]|nr:Glutathione-regulated potassium-efflux system protein KefB [uncultured archaeon]
MSVIASFVLGIGVAIAFVAKYLSSHVSSSELLLVELGAIIIMAAIFALFARLIKQPPILAYVIAGFIIGPAAFALVKDIEIIKSFSEIGIAFLLFIAGLEISFKKLKQVNIKKIILITTLQVFLVFFITLLLVKYIKLDLRQGVYISTALAFGSTMVVVKLLSDKGELVTMHGRIVLGILLLQDLFAILAVVLLTSEKLSIMVLAFALLKLVSMVLIAYLLQRFLFRIIFKNATESPHSKELLLLSSLAVLFAFVMIAISLELSIAIGAFIAGVSLANLPFRVELESRVGPLRDFFSILFFVALGMQITLGGLDNEFPLFLFLIVGAFILKPLITFLLLRTSGYRQRTAFVSSLALAQLSEFSIIVGVLGFDLGILSQSILSMIILTTIITMSLTVFFVDYEDKFYRVFKWPLSLLRFIPVNENLGYRDKEKKTVLLIGCDRMGSIILRELIKENKGEVLVLDYNPEVIAKLREKRISCIYGDVKSPDLLENLNLAELKKVVSTVPDLDDGLVLLEKLHKYNKNIQIILTAKNISDALELYDHGADYVMIPRFTAGEVVNSIMRKDKESLENIKANQIARIKSANSILK